MIWEAKLGARISGTRRSNTCCGTMRGDRGDPEPDQRKVKVKPASGAEVVERKETAPREWGVGRTSSIVSIKIWAASPRREASTPTSSLLVRTASIREKTSCGRE